MSITRIADGVFYEVASNGKKYKKVKTDGNMPIEASLFGALFQEEKKNLMEEKHEGKHKEHATLKGNWEEQYFSKNWKEDKPIGSKFDTAG